MKNNIFLVFIFIVLSVVKVEADTISLIDGSSFRGTLVYLSDFIYFKTENKNYRIKRDYIDSLLVTGSVDGISSINIFILRNDGIKISGKLLGVTNRYIVISRHIDGKISEIPLYTVLSYKTDVFLSKEFMSYENFVPLLYDNINVVIKEIISFLNENNLQSYYNLQVPEVDINKNDFYDRIWDLISIYLNDLQKSLAWDLIDLYYEKEKMYIISDFELKKAADNDIIKMRKKFIQRLRKSLYEMR